MEIIHNSTGHYATRPRRVDLYKRWKQPLHKWDSYIFNRHKRNKVIDDWSRYIINNTSTTGITMVYNCGGLFFKPFINNLMVIETELCPIGVDGIMYLNNDLINVHNDKIVSEHTLTNKFNTIITITPTAIRYHHSLVEFIQKPGESRAGYKPNLLKMLKPGGQFFISTQDWLLYYNRLKYTTDEFVDSEINKLRGIGLECVYKKITKSDDDYENGNIKLRLVKL